MTDQLTITITGPQGSGKTLVADWLRENLPRSFPRRPYQREDFVLPPIKVVDGEGFDQQSFVVGDPKSARARDAHRDIADRIRAGLADVEKLISEAEGMGLAVTVEQGTVEHFFRNPSGHPRRRVITTKLTADITQSL